MIAFDKWKNCLRVRYVGGSRFDNLTLAPGAEGIVEEFFGPRGEDFWQVYFAAFGTLNVHRDSIQVIDVDFVKEVERQESAGVSSLVKDAKEAVIYVTVKKVFKSLVVWNRDGKYVTIEDRQEAERLHKLLKAHRVPITQEIWYA